MISKLTHRLSKLDSCAVSDAMDYFDIMGVSKGMKPYLKGARISGMVITMKLGRISQRKSKLHIGVRAIELSNEGDIIVIDNQGKTEMSSWGGILSVAAKLKGVEGVIVDGAFRDSQECEKLNFPVFAKGSTAVTARGRIEEVSVNEQIDISGVKVHSGDYVIADESGVIFIPKERATEIIAKAEEIVKREDAIINQITSGGSISEILGEKFENMVVRHYE